MSTIVRSSLRFEERLSLSIQFLSAMEVYNDAENIVYTPYVGTRKDAKGPILSMIQGSTRTYGWDIHLGAIIAPTGILPRTVDISPIMDNVLHMIEWRSELLIGCIQFVYRSILPHKQPHIVIPDLSRPISSYLELHHLSSSIKDGILVVDGNAYIIPNALLSTIENMGLRP